MRQRAGAMVFGVVLLCCAAPAASADLADPPSISIQGQSGGHLELTGTPGNDDVVVTATDVDSGTVTWNGGLPVAFDDIDELSWSGGDGDDWIEIVNPTAGVFAPANGIHVDGGDPTTKPGDGLGMSGGHADHVTHTAGATPDSGTIERVRGTTVARIDYAKLEPVADTAPADDLTLKPPAPGVNNGIVMVQGPGTMAEPWLSVTFSVSSVPGEVYHFANKKNVVIDGDGGTDTWSLAAAEPSAGLESFTAVGAAGTMYLQTLRLPGVSVSLNPGGAATDVIIATGGDIAASQMRLTAGGSITATDASNDVGTLSVRSTVAGGVSFTDTNALNVGEVLGQTSSGANSGDASIKAGGALSVGQPLNATDGVLTLEAASGGQTAAGMIGGQSIRLLGGTSGPMTFTGAANTASAVAASTTGAAALGVSSSSTVSTVAGTTGFASSAGSATVLAGGDLTVSQPVSAAGTGTASVAAAGATSTLTNNSSVSGPTAVAAADNQVLAGGTINAGTGTATLGSFTAGREVTLGTEVAGTLSLTDAELDTVTAGTLQTASTSAGNTTITAPVQPASVTNLILRSGGQIVDGNTTGPDVRAEGVGFVASTGVGGLGDPIETASAFLEAATATGGVRLDTTGKVRVGGVSPSLSGLSVATSGNLVLTAGGTLSIGDTDGAETIKGGSTSGNVTLFAPASISFPSNHKAISAPAGDVSVESDNHITLGLVGMDSDNDIRAGRSVHLVADGILRIDGDADVRSDDFGLNSGEGIELTAGDELSIDDAGGTGASVVGPGIVTSALTTRLGSPADTLATTGNQTLHIITNNLEIEPDAEVDAGTGRVRLQARVGGTGFDLGPPTDAGTPVEISDAELDRVSAGRIEVLGGNGNVAVTGPITPALSDSLFLDAAALTQSAPLIVPNLRAAAITTATLSDPGNDADTFAGSAGTALTFTDTDAVTVGPAAGGQAISVPTGTARVAGSGAVTQAPGAAGVITADTLEVPGGAAVDLQNPANAVNKLSGTSGGTFSFQDSVPLAVVGSGIQSPGSDIDLAANQMDLAGAPTSAGGGVVRLRSLTPGRPTQLGSSDPATSLALSDAELDQITAARIEIGGGDAGPVTVGEAITPSGTGSLRVTGAGFAGEGAGLLSESTLRLTDNSAGGTAWIVDANLVMHGGSGPIPYSAVDQLQLDGGTGADSFDVKASPTTTYTLDGADPAAAPGDTLSYNAEGRAVSGDLSTPDGQIDSPDRRPVVFQRVEAISVTGLPAAPPPPAAPSAEPDDVFAPGSCSNRVARPATGAFAGTRAGDYLLGNDTAETIAGGDGDDCIEGRGGRDTIDAGAGADRVRGGAGNDRIDGGAGNERYLRGEAGNDAILGGAGNDSLSGGNGNDRLSGGAGGDTLIGGNGSDALTGGAGRNTYFGRAGSDSINARNGVRETVNCGSGRDAATVDANDRVIGCEVVRRG